MLHWYVWLTNEDGVKVRFEVKGENQPMAIKAAWKAYRELSYWDNEDPPYWTYPETFCHR